MTTHPNQSHAVTSAPRGGLARVLTSLAGVAASWRARRRGSFLVMVVGTLALLAVFAILYVSIGNQDTRAKAANVHREALDDVPEQFARYIARDIVARDVLSRWYPQGEGSTGTPSIPIGWREATDYPSIDWTRRSDGLNQSTFFDPVGTMDLPSEFFTAFATNYPDRWNPTDPWLATTEPTWLNFAGAPLPTNLPEYMLKVDWGQISNVAPDGRFINLYNLRNNFDALPGVGNDPSGLPRLSTGLSLFGPNGLMMATPATDFGLGVGGNAAKQVPAYWTARQQGAFRPLSMPGDAGPDSPLWPQYQWADADGDGMLDSRWFTMTEWREGSPGQPGHEVRNLLDTDGNIRYVFATRIIDLSSLVNVNTAADMRAAPNLQNPAGVTPGDIDLRRLLTLRDRIDLDAYLTGTVFSAYDGLPQGTLAEDYTTYDPAMAHETARHGYTALRLALECRSTPPRFSTGNPATRYTAPGGSLETGFPTDFGITPVTFINDFAANPVFRVNAVRRHEATLLGTYVDTSFPSGTMQITGGFGLADTVELLTFRATNDLAFTSNLEHTVGGRNDMADVAAPAPGDPAAPGSMALSPLRDNRGPAIEGFRSFASTAAKRATLLHFAADVRQRLTGLSGARDLRSMRGADPDVLAAGELKSNISGTSIAGSSLFGTYLAGLAPRIETGWWNMTSGGGAEHMTEFYGYRGPELAVLTAAFMAVNAVDARDNGDTPTSYTVALDVSFPDPNPGAPGDGTIEEADAALADDQQLFPAQHAGREFDAGINRLADASAGDTPTAPAVNVFGIEAQPFITQVTTFTVYCDAPDSAGGDVEANSGSTEVTIDGDITESNADFLYRVLAIQLTNPFGSSITLGSNIFPQASEHNVLDPAFPPLDRQDGFYYIEFGGRYFKVASLEEQVYIDAATDATREAANLPSLGDDARIGQYTDLGATGGQPAITLNPITIPAGRTVTLYAMSQMPRYILSERLGDVDGSMTTQQKALRSTIQQAIRNNLDADSDIAGVYWIPEFNATTDGRISLPGSATVRDPVPSSASVVNLYRAVRNGDPTDPGEGHRANTAIPARFWDQTTGPTTTSHELYDEMNLVANDRLMDRFRVPAGLDRKLPASNEPVSGTDALDPVWDEGCTLVLWANVRRPRDPGIAGLNPRIPAGAFPAYCMEPKYVSGWNILTTDPLTPTSLAAGDFTGGYDPGAARNPRNWRIEVSTTTLSNLTAYQSPRNIVAGAYVGDAAHSNPVIRGTDDFPSRYAEIVLPNGQTSGANATTGPARLGDMLLPLGIGPCEKPLTIGGSVEANPNIRWTTLGEAMATALGYENYAGLPAGEVMAAYLPTADPLDPGYFISPLDRGNLRLDRFVPFFDANADGAYDPAAGDERRGMEIPPAMAVLDGFTAAGPVGQGLQYGRQGIININTAPLITMRALPMLTPPPDTEPGGGAWWWWPTTSPIRGVDVTSDIAATVHAYRDKTDTFTRPQSSAASPTGDQLTFIDQPAGTTPDAPYEDLNGRATWAEIPAIRETPGFISLGEMLAARFRNGAAAPPDYPSNMDFLGYDTRGTTANQAGNNSRLGVSPVLVDNGPGAPSPDRLSNEYKELLTVFNAVSGTVTTRSDLFACWFLVHGYKKADVENVAADQPIVASVQRRFLMILDRSKVTKRGDSAEIVYMKEVPLTPQ